MVVMSGNLTFFTSVLTLYSGVSDHSPEDPCRISVPFRAISEGRDFSLRFLQLVDVIPSAHKRVMEPLRTCRTDSRISHLNCPMLSMTRAMLRNRCG